MTSWRILIGDVREQLATLPSGSVRCCVTSPPYFGLRDYGHVGQIGLEPTPDAYVAAMVAVFAEVWRVLANDGTLWLNIGDCYAAQRGGTAMPAETLAGGVSGQGDVIAKRGRGDGIYQPHRNASSLGLKHKDLFGIPWMVAFALRADGWYLRSDIIWSKPNPMPESVTDRPTKAHEYIFLLSKSARYHYDAEAIAEPLAACSLRRYQHAVDTNERFDPKRHKSSNGIQSPMEVLTRAAAGVIERGNRNKRTVWTVATQSFEGAHFATYPEALIEPCILAGSAPGDTVLDPFCGSGTTGAVAIRHQRHFVGVELNPAYVALARKRIGAVAPLFAEEASA